MYIQVAEKYMCIHICIKATMNNNIQCQYTSQTVNCSMGIKYKVCWNKY